MAVMPASAVSIRRICPGCTSLDNDVTVAEVLKDAGYTTGMIGKWGLGVIKADWKDAEQGLPWRQGFDYFYGYLTHGHAHNYYPDFLWRNESKEPLRERPFAQAGVQRPRGGEEGRLRPRFSCEG